MSVVVKWFKNENYMDNNVWIIKPPEIDIHFRTDFINPVVHNVLKTNKFLRGGSKSPPMKKMKECF